MKKLNALIAATLLAALPALAAPPAPVYGGSNSAGVKDQTGRPLYIVDLKEGTDADFAETRAESSLPRFSPRHSGKVKNMAESFERQYGLNAADMTSWVGLSITAYLNKNQVDALQSDARVERITEAMPVEFSSLPPWSDNPVLPDSFYHQEGLYPEVKPWGVQAVNGKPSYGGTNIYLIDAGVGYHAELGRITRVNPSCYNPGQGQNSYNCNLPVVGCYPHATAVAGIIAAKSANGGGTVGVNPGATLVSVSTSNQINTGPNMNCTYAYGDTATVAAALDWIRSDIYTRNRWKPGIVNLSMNDPTGKTILTSETIKTKMRALASGLLGGTYYAGAFIAQSAGNYGDNACPHGYNETNPGDGIMVVGAVDKLGHAASSLNGGAGSSYGSCVEVWAPGKEIIHLWADMPYVYGVGESQSGNTTYNAYLRMDGTSWAAPHVAAIAAYLADTQGLTSAPAIEAAVRSLFYWTGARDALNYPVNMITLP